MTEKITSAAIKAALRVPFQAPGWQVLYEVADDTGTRATRSADAIAVGIWPSNGHLIHGFEIKVSRGDFLNEMRDPTKSQAVFQFCDRWTLVTPVGMVKTNELPDTWGLMTFDGTTIRTVKQAPPLVAQPMTRGFMSALLRRAAAPGEDVIKESVARAVELERKRLDKEIAHRVQREKERLISKNGDAAEELGTYKEIFGDLTVFDIRRMAPAVRSIQKLGLTDTWGAINQITRTMQQSLADLQEIRGRLNDDII